MKYTPFVFLLMLLSGQVFGQASAKDSTLFRQARASLSAGECNDALASLQNISINGKDDPSYLILMARMHECKTNLDQAIYFYERYIAAAGDKDSVQKHVEHLRAMLDGNEGHKNNKLNSRRKDLHNRFWSLDLEGIGITGGHANTNYNYGWQFNTVIGGGMIKDHAAWEFYAGLGQLLSPNKEWFSSVLNTPADNIHKIGSAFTMSLGGAFKIGIIDKKDFSLAAGPSMGIRFFATPNHDETYQGPDYEDNNHWAWVTPVIGYNIRFKYKERFTLFTTYDRVARRGFDVNGLDHITGQPTYLYTAPIAINVFTVGAGIILDDLWWW